MLLTGLFQHLGPQDISAGQMFQTKISQDPGRDGALA